MLTCLLARRAAAATTTAAVVVCVSAQPNCTCQAGLTVHAALVPAQLASSWGGAPGLRDDSGADQHVWAR